MGHLLSTVNPEAANAITSEAVNPFAVREPYIGEIVHYHSRSGEGRSGKTVFPAHVMKVSEDGALELLVLYGVDDMREYPIVRPKTYDQPYHAWSFVPGAIDHGGKIKMIEEAVFGISEPVEESVYEMITALGKRIKDIEADGKRIAHLERLVEKLRKKGGGDSAED